MSSLFSALAAQATNQNQNNDNSNSNSNSNNAEARGRQPAARRGGFSIANGALRSAGLMDDNTGMREARAGPSRNQGGFNSRGTRGRGGRVAGRNGEGSSRMTVDDNSFSSSGSRGGRGGSSSARDRSNPLAQSGRARRGGGNHSSSNPADVGIRGAADKRGRVPGGGAELIGSSSASVIASAQQGSNSSSGASGSNPAGGKLIEGLRRFLASRWNEAAQFLNLEAMSQDPILQELGFKPPGVQGSPKDSGSAIFKLCSEIYPNIATISLARNNLVNLGPVSTIPQFLPLLKNISLEGNELKWVKDLNVWTPSGGKSSKSSKRSGGKSAFKGLSELVLTGNPVRETFTATGNEEAYRSDVLRKFPTLTLLDGIPVTTAESDFAKLPSSERKSNASSGAGGSLQGPPRNFGIGMRPGFKEPTAESITNGFLSKYFSLFDSDRSSLEAAYASNSTFTFSVNGHSSPRARSAGYYKSLPNQVKLDWSAYNNQDPRNVMRSGTRKISGVREGPGGIIVALKHFPQTTHPVNDPSKFVVDSWILPNDEGISSSVSPNEPKPEAILFINVHGEFSEKPSEGIRSFDRVFIVAPAPPGSAAANAGWPCLILNDQLTLRHYTGSNAWIENALPTDAQPGTYNPMSSASNSAPTSSTTAPSATPLGDLPPHLQNQPPQAGISEQQHLLSLQLAAQTGLTYPFAVQCMEGNSWDPSQAMANFQALKAANTIPPEAFAVA